MRASRTWPERVKRGALAAAFTIFTAGGIAEAVAPHTGFRDRAIAIAGAVFFGAGGLGYFARDRLERGQRWQLSPALRIGDQSLVFDRLELRASPARIAALGGAILFFGAGAVIGFTLVPGILGDVVGGGAVLFVLAGAYGVIVALRGPLIIFERDRLRYRWPRRPWLDVPYGRISGATVVETGVSRACGLGVHDLEAFLEAATPPARREHLNMLRYYGVPVVLPYFVAPNAEQLTRLVAAYIAGPQSDAVEDGPLARTTRRR